MPPNRPWKASLIGQLGENYVETWFRNQKLRLKRLKTTYSNFDFADFGVEEKTFNGIGAILPDYRIRGEKTFVEVKTGNFAIFEKTQRKAFPIWVSNGWRILIAKPQLTTTTNKIEFNSIQWFELRNNRAKFQLDAVEPKPPFNKI